MASRSVDLVGLAGIATSPTSHIRCTKGSCHARLTAIGFTYAGTSQGQTCAPRITDILVLRSFTPDEVDPSWTAPVAKIWHRMEFCSEITKRRLSPRHLAARGNVAAANVFVPANEHGSPSTARRSANSAMTRWLSAPSKGRVFQPLPPPIWLISRHNLKFFLWEKSRMGAGAIVTRGPRDVRDGRWSPRLIVGTGAGLGAEGRATAAPDEGACRARMPLAPAIYTRRRPSWRRTANSSYGVKPHWG
jgi:hypothetical protein